MQEADNTGDEFAKVAIRLLHQFGRRVRKIRNESLDLVERHAETEDKAVAKVLVWRHEQLATQFHMATDTFYKLIRQASQWLQHGKNMQPHLRLELEILTSDLENQLNGLGMQLAMAIFSEK